MADIALPFRVYEGVELFRINEHKLHPIVEDLLFEDDFVIIVAEQKTVAIFVLG